MNTFLLTNTFINRQLLSKQLTNQRTLIPSDGATRHFFLSLCVMKKKKFPQYFYSHIEYPELDRETSMRPSCELEGFFKFYCSILNGRSQNYIARLPAFDQCTSMKNDTTKLVRR